MVNFAQLTGARHRRLDLAQAVSVSLQVAEMLDGFRGPAQVDAMVKRYTHPCDPTDVIHEAYRIEGITTEECRSIFFDWAVGLAAGIDPVASAKTLQSELATADPEHPMSRLLTEAAQGLTPARGHASRRRSRS